MKNSSQKNKPNTGVASKYANLIYSDFCNESSKYLKLIPIDMGYGDPAANHFIPRVLHDYLIEELSKKNAGAYPDVSGDRSLIEKYKEYIKKDEGLTYDYDVTVVSGGGRSAITNILKIFIKPGDLILVPYPAWSGYKSLAKFVGAKIFPVHTYIKNRFICKDEDVELAIKEAKNQFPDNDIGLMILNTPHNPSGTVYYHDSIKEILKVLKKYNIYCLADYTYRAIRDYKDPLPSLHKIAEEIEFEEQLPKGTFTDSIIAMQTLGKVSLTPGFRIGYISSTNKNISANFQQNKQATDFSGSLFIQKAFARYLLTVDQERDFSKTVSMFEERRNTLLNELKKYGYTPENNNIILSKSGFYVSFEIPKKYQKKYNLSNLPEFLKQFPFIEKSISKEEYAGLFKDKGYIPASEIFVLNLISKTSVNVLPGHLFSPQISNKVNEYENWVRVALINDTESIKEAFRRIENNKDIFEWEV